MVSTGSGCTDSSGGGGTGGASAIGAAGAGGGAPGGAAGGAVGGAAGDGDGQGGAAGSVGGARPPCALTAPATSGIDPTTPLDALTPDQKAAFCDWAASRYCGYDKHVACADHTTLDSFPTQAECVANMTATSCSATVADSEACERDSTCADPFPDSCLPATMCQ